MKPVVEAVACEVTGDGSVGSTHWLGTAAGDLCIGEM